jgi:flagellar biosynthesis/type III secretory pathway protein FliH
LKLVKSLGGVATKTNDDFDTITFSVTGIPSLEVLEDKYSQVVNNEDDNYVALGSWDLQPVDSETTSLSEMYTDMKEEGEGFQSQHADSADWERFYQEGWNAGYDEGYRDAKKEFNTTGNNDYYKFFR